MTDRFDRNRRPFATLPLHWRGNEVVRLKTRIRRDAAVYGGRYTSHHVPPDPDRPDLCCQWGDFKFPGRDRFTWWNAEMITARQVFWYAARDAAFDRAYAQLDACEQSREFSHEGAGHSLGRTTGGCPMSRRTAKWATAAPFASRGWGPVPDCGGGLARAGPPRWHSREWNRTDSWFGSEGGQAAGSGSSTCSGSADTHVDVPVWQVSALSNAERQRVFDEGSARKAKKQDKIAYPPQTGNVFIKVLDDEVKGILSDGMLGHTAWESQAILLRVR